MARSVGDALICPTLFRIGAATARAGTNDQVLTYPDDLKGRIIGVLSTRSNEDWAYTLDTHLDRTLW